MKWIYPIPIIALLLSATLVAADAYADADAGHPHCVTLWIYTFQPKKMCLFLSHPNALMILNTMPASWLVKRLRKVSTSQDGHVLRVIAKTLAKAGRQLLVQVRDVTATTLV